MPDPASDIGTLTEKFFGIIKDDPPVALVAIAFAVLIVFAIMFINKLGTFGKVFVGAVMVTCLTILGLGTYLLMFSPGSNNGIQHSQAQLEIRLDNKSLVKKDRGKGDSTIRIDDGELYKRRVQLVPQSGSWSDHMLLRGRPNKLLISISNRRSIFCREKEDAGTAILSDEFETPSDSQWPQIPGLANSTFRIDLSEAYEGDDPLNLKLEYVDNQKYEDKRLVADRLVFLQWDGLNKEKIRVFPNHDETRHCIDDTEIYHEFAKVNTKIPATWFGIASAWAGELIQDQKNYIRTFTRRNTQSGKARINDYFEQKRSEIAPVSTSILSDTKIPAHEKRQYLETLLQLPVSERTRTRAFLDALMPFVTHKNYNIRRSAARLLRAADYVNDDVAEAFVDYFNREGEKLAGRQVDKRDYSEQYLAVAAGRDIFYNLGINRINQLRREFTSLDVAKRQQALDKAIEAFVTGKKYQSYAPEDRKVLFSKLQYGVSYAYFSQAVAEAANKNASAKTSADLQDAISKSLNSDTSLPASDPLAASTLRAFDQFIKSLGAGKDRYSWQHHISQAENCLKSRHSLAVNCMQNAAKG